MKQPSQCFIHSVKWLGVDAIVSKGHGQSWRSGAHSGGRVTTVNKIHAKEKQRLKDEGEGAERACGGEVRGAGRRRKWRICGHTCKESAQGHGSRSKATASRQRSEALARWVGIKAGNPSKLILMLKVWILKLWGFLKNKILFCCICGSVYLTDNRPWPTSTTTRLSVDDLWRQKKWHIGFQTHSRD